MTGLGRLGIKRADGLACVPAPQSKGSRTALWAGSVVLLLVACGGGESGNERFPVIHSQPVTAATVGKLYQYQVQATHPDGLGLTYTLDGDSLARGMNIAATTGLVSWTPQRADLGTRRVTVTVADPTASTARQSYEIAVTGNEPPWLLPVPDAKVGPDMTLRFQPAVLDLDPGDVLRYTLDANSISRGMRVDPDLGLFAWTPSRSDLGIHTVQLTVTDSGGESQSRSFAVTVPDVLPKNGWSLHYVDSAQCCNERAEYAFDGNPATAWHSRYTGGIDPVPHDIRINLGGLYDIDGFRYLPRQDREINGRIEQFAFYVSTDGVDWGEPVVSGMFANTRDEKEVVFPQTTGRYIRLVAFSEVNGRNYTSMAELTLLGSPFSGNHRPRGLITSPAHDLVLTVGDSADFSADATDPDNHLPLTYRWDFGDPDIPPSTAANPGPVRFDRPGTFVVRMQVTDALGRADSAPPTRIVQVREPAAERTLAKQHWRLRYATQEESGAEARQAFDGNAGSYWLSQPSPSSPRLPHELQIDLGAAYQIDALRYLPRQDAEAGRIDRYEIYVSSDGVDWGRPVASGRFENTSAEQRRAFPPKTGRFVRLVALSEVNGDQWAAVQEIDLEGSCHTPSVRIALPDGFLQASEDLAVPVAACLDPLLHAGWGVKVQLDGGIAHGGAEQIVYQAPYTAVFPQVPKAEHSLTAILLDAHAAELSGTLAHHQIHRVAIGDYYAAVGDSITVGIRDDFSADDISADGRSTAGGYTPILADLLSEANGFPHLVAMAGVSGDTSRDGISHIRRVLRKHPGARHILLQYGTNDAGFGTPATVFRANMQQIIDQITASGKQVYLAKVPYTNNSVRNEHIRAYNQEIDALVALNGIPVVPPDFFAHFEANPQQLADTSHPNGEGYRSMAGLWRDALP